MQTGRTNYDTDQDQQRTNLPPGVTEANIAGPGQTDPRTKRAVMDSQGVSHEFEGEPVAVVPFVDRTFQTLQQMIKENRDYTEAQAAAVRKQVLAAQEQSAMAERRATEAERRNQELFEQLQRDTLATHASMQQAVSASVATITTWVEGQEARRTGNTQAGAGYHSLNDRKRIRRTKPPCSCPRRRQDGL